MKRWILVGAGVLLAALFAYRLYQQVPAAGAGAAGFRDGPGASARTVRAGVAEIGPIAQTVNLVGSLRPQERVEVTPKVTGRIVEVAVDLGDSVSTGQLLARMEDDEIQQQVQQAEAGLEVTRATIEQRRLELANLDAILERSRGLHDQGLISGEDLEAAQNRRDVAQSQLDLARAQLVQAEASFRELRIRLDQMQIRAPISGVVGRRYVDTGAQVSSTTPVVTLIKLDTVKLVANVPERDLMHVEPGSTGTVRADAIQGETFTGTVARISPLLDPETRTAQVEIVVPNPEHRLKAEMFARVELDLASRRDALRVPREALVIRGQQQGVYVIDDDSRVRFRPVALGITQDDWIEVEEGLTPGERVVTLGANLLRDGDPVRVSQERPTEEATSS